MSRKRAVLLTGLLLRLEELKRIAEAERNDWLIFAIAAIETELRDDLGSEDRFPNPG